MSPRNTKFPRAALARATAPETAHSMWSTGKCRKEHCSSGWPGTSSRECISSGERIWYSSTHTVQQQNSNGEWIWHSNWCTNWKNKGGIVWRCRLWAIFRAHSTAFTLLHHNHWCIICLCSLNVKYSLLPVSIRTGIHETTQWIVTLYNKHKGISVQTRVCVVV